MVPFEQDSLARLAAPNPDRTWLETFVICALTLTIGIAIQPNDPLFAFDEEFPWPLLAPILLGLRYGFAQAFIAAVALHVFALAYDLVRPLDGWPLPFGYSLGVLLTAMIAGEFRDIWEQRLQKLERSNQYRQARLEEFTRSYHVLKISHDRLEQDSAGKRNSLRSALLGVKSSALAEQESEFGAGVLELFATYGSLQAGSLHLLGSDAGADVGAILGKIVASMGAVNQPNATDELITQTLTTGLTSSLNPDNPAAITNRKPGDCIACVPLADAYREIRGVVVVHQMPFFAFTEKNLQLLSIVAGQVGDYLAARERLATGDDHEAYQFLFEVLRCLDNSNRFDLQAALLGIEFSDPALAPGLIDTMRGELRGLDCFLPVTEGENKKLLLLMPLTDRTGLDQYMIRFGEFLERAHGVGIKQSGMVIHQKVITKATRLDEVETFLRTLLKPGNALLAMLRGEHKLDRVDGL